MLQSMGLQRARHDLVTEQQTYRHLAMVWAGSSALQKGRLRLPKLVLISP